METQGLKKRMGNKKHGPKRDQKFETENQNKKLKLKQKFDL